MKKKPNTRRASPERGPFFAGHPLNDIPFDQQKQIAVAHGNQAREKFKAALPKLIELISRIDPLHTLALMSMYGLMVTPDQQGDHKNPRSPVRIQQGHIEFLQALCLMSSLKRDAEFPEPQSIQTLFDLLPELFSAHNDMRIGTSTASELESASETDPAVVQVQEFLRGHTSSVRNWGYFGNVTRITRKLLSTIDNDYERQAGMKLSKVVDVFEGLLRRHERKVNKHLEMVHSAFSLKTKAEMLDKFFAIFPIKGATGDIRAQLLDPKISREDLKAALLPWADRFIGREFIITNQEIADECSLDPETAGTLTNRISLAFTDLEDETPESFFLGNPVWLRPLIYLEKDHYFCSLPQTLFSFILPIVDEILTPYNGLQNKLNNARAKFLEDEVAHLFASAFPGSLKHQGFKWIEGTQQFESDLIVRFDTTIILVEAKSGRISWPALRGAPNRLVEHIKKLIVEPSDQSGRLAQRIGTEISNIRNGGKPSFDFPLPLHGVTCVVRLSVMLHDFATIQSVPSMLEKAGLLRNKYPLAPCMSLADLEVMLDLLETPQLRLHYLRRRAELLMSLNTIGDEMDMLGIYLDTAFNLGTLQVEKNTLITSGYSAKIDRYYSLKDESISSKKPKPNISDWFKRLCEQLAKRGRPGWSETACALLSVAPKDQFQLERHVRNVAARVKAGKSLRGNKDSIVLIPPRWINQALAVQVRHRDAPLPYSSHSQNIANQAFESKHVKRCFVLVVDAADINLSYLSVAMFTEAETDHTVFY